jgi:hypothetical protein
MESPDESEVELPTVVTTNASSNASALTSSVIGRPRKDDIWHHVSKTVTDNGKVQQDCKYCTMSRCARQLQTSFWSVQAALIDDIEDERE